MQKRAVVALDVGGTKIASGLLLDDGQILFHRSIRTSRASVEEQVVSMIEEAILEAPRDVTVAAVGIAVPGWVNHSSRTVWAPNIPGWDRIPLEEIVSEKVPAPVIVDSDRSACVTGEAWLGAARGLQDVVFLAVGTGIGAGILAEGRIIHGHDDLAGAVGWLALNPRYQEIYKRIGCFEAEASGNSVARKSGDAGLSAREVIQRAQSGDAVSGALLEEVVLFLGMGVANLVSTLNPQMVVLGGGLFGDGAHLLERVRQEFSRWAQPFAAQRVRLELSLLGDRAGLLGAARIAFDNI